MIERKEEHYYYFYGHIVKGYGPSMDPHRHGHPDEPCVIITYEREITDWTEVSREKLG